MIVIIIMITIDCNHFSAAAGRPLVIVEGFLILEDERLVQLLDKVVLLQISRDVCYNRRIARNNDKLSDYLVDGDEVAPNWLDQYFDDAVWPNALKYSGKVQVLNDQESPALLKGTSFPKVLAINGEINQDDLHREVLSLVPQPPA